MGCWEERGVCRWVGAFRILRMRGPRQWWRRCGVQGCWSCMQQQPTMSGIATLGRRATETRVVGAGLAVTRCRLCWRRMCGRLLRMICPPLPHIRDLAELQKGMGNKRGAEVKGESKEGGGGLCV